MIHKSISHEAIKPTCGNICRSHWISFSNLLCKIIPSMSESIKSKINDLQLQVFMKVKFLMKIEHHYSLGMFFFFLLPLMQAEGTKTGSECSSLMTSFAYSRSHWLSNKTELS